MQTNQATKPTVQQPITRINEHRPTSSGFTFDLDGMKQAVNSPKVKVPKSAIQDDASFDKWLND